ncbi:MAG: penicillin-binding protein 2, partial [Patescibacteria group bacterium]
LEEELDLLREKWQPELAIGIVLEPATGKILALAARPTYDPNAYSAEKDFSVFRIPIVDSQFELGSVFKPITMAAGINERVITASTTYGDPGVRRFGTFSVSNFDGRSYGTQTMTQVLEKSLNTGAMFAMERVGQERFFEYIKSFGFGEPTGIDVPGELAGNISNLSLGRDVDYATASFGQGIAMTPLQIAMGMAAIANDGTLMRPYIVEKLIDDSGAEEIRRPQEVRRVISPESSETLTRMLVSAVRNGFENRAGVKGYFVAGKTGTAQIPLQDRRGYSDDVIHTFVGYAPAFQPRFLVLLELVKPRGNRFAANTLTPVFHNLSQFMQNYYDVPPDER